MEDRFKFRVWDTHRNTYDNSLQLKIDVTGDIKVFSLDEGTGNRFRESKSSILIEQCTGLKDKNGRLIYEGDIIKWDNELYSPEVVSWEYDTCTSSVGLSAVDENTEIIGNIHENSDLID